MVGQFGPRGACEQQRVDPGPEAMAGERTEETFLGAFSVSNDDGVTEALFHHRPEFEEGGRADQVLIPDAVNLFCRPGDWTRGAEVGNEWLGVTGADRPFCQSNLDRDVGLPACRTCRLEVDPGKANLANGGIRRHGRSDAFAVGKRKFFPVR